MGFVNQLQCKQSVSLHAVISDQVLTAREARLSAERHLKKMSLATQRDPRILGSEQLRHLSVIQKLSLNTAVMHFPPEVFLSFKGCLLWDI